MDNPEPTDEEHEQAGTQRHREEEDMRGADRPRENDVQAEEDDEA